MSDAATSRPALVAEHGLTPRNIERAVAILGRTPNLTELGIFSVMWSEHCSYKSSKIWLKTLPTTGPHVICGPGENAGVVDIGDGEAVDLQDGEPQPPVLHRALPGRGDRASAASCATCSRWARGRSPTSTRCASAAPIIRKTRHLVAGVVAGIGGYGNCVGVPTVGGECNFHPAYNGNILVNAMSVGIARDRQDLLFGRGRARATR